MRVTEGLTYSQMRTTISQAQSRAYTAANVASSGKRVAKSSDDPTSYARSMVMRQGLTRLDGMDRGSNIATDDLTVADDALAASENAIVRAREIAIAGANTTLSPSDRLGYADEVAGLRATLLAQANSRSGDTYVFAGGKVTTPAFADDGTYSGDDSVRAIEVAPGQTVNANSPGGAIFTPASGVSAFDVLSRLEANLRSSNVPAVTAQLTELDTVHAQLVSGRTGLGVELQRSQAAAAARDSVRVQIESARSAAVDADTVGSYSALMQAQQALESAIAAAQKMMQTMQSGLNF
jgi:flagellar hook-associated protein 3 FlgL